MKLNPQCFKIKTLKLFSIFILVIHTNAWSSDSSDFSSNSQAAIFTDIIDVNIGYPTTKGPVPLKPRCLFPIARPDATTTIFAGAAVEPSIAVNPKTPNIIVAGWQQDRINNGGALECPIGFSHDGGLSWERTTVPFQKCLGGLFQRSTDTWLSYSADGSHVYCSVYGFNITEDPNQKQQQAILVSRSNDGGRTWKKPHIVGQTRSVTFPALDKNSITADPNIAQNAYCVWDRFGKELTAHSITQISKTDNFGKTWSRASLVYDPFPDLLEHHQSNDDPNDNQTINNIVVVLPKATSDDQQWTSDLENEDSKTLRFSGDLLNFMTRIYAKPGATNEEYVFDRFPSQFTLFDIAFVRSKDQGETWNKNAAIVTSFVNAFVFTGGYTIVDGNITGGIGTRLRTANEIFSCNVNPKNGFLYLVWQTGQFREDQLPQLALTTSRDGGLNWSEPIMINRTPQDCPNPQAFNPFVAITEEGLVGVLYSDFRKDKKSDLNRTKTDTWLAFYQEVKDPHGGSTKAGLNFIKEVRLSKKSYIVQNGPTTGLGVMTTADYPFLTAQKNTFYAIQTQSFDGPFSPPREILNDPATNTILLLDENYRQAPFFSKIQPF